ncbi:LOW QUALITY PROTEIN: uncharacterized protein [Thunnus thynnus]|uniref:LOW QUALITY PROTEIN: uncharacterized protein n=1 Tax=Thunnus thynnus TaxID=8237 RepID=UPI003526C971
MARSIRALEREVVELQAFADSTGERGHIENLKTKRSVLADLLGTSARGAVVRSRFQNVALMDAPSHFFFGLERKNGQRRQMMSLRSHTGQLLQESADIRRFAASFYGDLFRSEYTENPEVSHFFYADLPKVSEDANAELGNEISSEELYAALQGLRGGTSPGIDGLPADFYKTFWSVLGGDLLMVLNDSVKKGRLPQSCRRAVLTLLPKKGELQDIKNWRPVSLLCTDYKLLSKVLANRMRKVMEQVIHVDQTYCVPGRLLSAYADDVIVLVQKQSDIDSLVDSVENFGLISSSKVNWEKSEALMVGDGLKQLSLPGRLTWKKGGIKYLGVYLGDPTTVSKNWENVLEKAEANLLSNIQRVIVDFFWDHLHWIPQSVLFLAKDDGGQGLIHLASRGAVFRLQHIQRLLTGPADLVWRPVARAILGQVHVNTLIDVQIYIFLLSAETGLQDVSDYKNSLRMRFQEVTEGIDEDERTLLNDIYTELYITEGRSEDVNTQHEVRQLETASKMKTLYDTPIKCHDIFKPLPDKQKYIRVVMTNGVAGVGKTFSVLKFTLDWAEGSKNQDVSLVIPLSFRELNLIKDERYSLLMLIHKFHPTLQEVTAENLKSKDCKVVFIFDGLDESRLELDFKNNEVVSDVTQQSSVNVLFTNLIKRNLLPSALIWITSRPAAANQILDQKCVNRVTEVRGFTDDQKEEYFRKRFSNEELSNRIISHIKTSRSLHIMCYIPVFCWIIATVLEQMLTTDQRGELPKTLTDMYSHFLLLQTKRKKNKYDKGHETSPQELTKADRKLLLKLGRLAFEQLQKGNIIFYQEDLEQCGLDVTEASVLSGFCTEIFRREKVFSKKTVYCFVHLSIQEFLAAVYMYHCYTSSNTEVLKDFLGEDFKCSKSILRKILAFFRNNDYPDSSLDDFLKRAMEKSLQSKNGHLDLFARFLHGLSLESNQGLLGGLLGQTENSPEIIQRVINNLKKMNTYTSNTSPDRSINIFHCLMEMNDLSVHQEIQEFLKSENRSEKELSDPLLSSGLHAADVRGGSG